MRTLHAPTRELSLAPCVLISPFTWMRSSVAQASAAERWSMMDLESTDNRSLSTDGIPVDDETAHAQAHGRGVPSLLLEFHRCRAALRKRTLTPHTTPCLTLVFAFRATGRAFGSIDQGRVSVIVAAIGVLRSRVSPVSSRPTAEPPPVEPFLQARRATDDVSTRCSPTASSFKGAPSPPRRPRAGAAAAPRVLLRLRGHPAHAPAAALSHTSPRHRVRSSALQASIPGAIFGFSSSCGRRCAPRGRTGSMRGAGSRRAFFSPCGRQLGCTTLRPLRCLWPLPQRTWRRPTHPLPWARGWVCSGWPSEASAAMRSDLLPHGCCGLHPSRGP